MSVKRYYPQSDTYLEMIASDDGKWVRYSDYQSLLQERDALKARLEEVRNETLEEAANFIRERGRKAGIYGAVDPDITAKELLDTFKSGD